MRARTRALSVAVILCALTASAGLAGAAAPEGKIYLLPLGYSSLPPNRSADLRALAQTLSRRFRISIVVLGDAPIDSGYDPRRRQMVAEELIALMKRKQPRLAADPQSFLMGVTPYDMYARARAAEWIFVFTWRTEGRLAITSAARLDPVSYGRAPNPPLLQTRLRKLMIRNLGLLYFGLDVSENRQSVLYRDLLGVDDLDAMSENF